MNVGCVKCGATDIPVIGHEPCPGAVEPFMYQHLRANNDVNGNPRRCFVIYDYDANIIDVIDEGYVGRPKWVSALRQLATLDIGISEYKNLLKMAAKWEES